MPHVFITSCVDAVGEDIQEMQDIATDIDDKKFLTMAKKLGFKEDVLDMLGFSDWSESSGDRVEKLFANDWGKSCHASLYQGLPCLYVRHSAIEYVYMDAEQARQVLSAEDAKHRQTRISVLKDDWEEHVYKMIGNTQQAYKKIISDFLRTRKDDFAKDRIPLQSVIDWPRDAKDIAVKMQAAISRDLLKAKDAENQR